jgi:hypothetical protein
MVSNQSQPLDQLALAFKFRFRYHQSLFTISINHYFRFIMIRDGTISTNCLFWHCVEFQLKCKKNDLHQVA